MSTSYIEFLAYHYILNDDRALLEKIKPNFFTTCDTLRICYRLGRDYAKKYLKEPSKEELLRIVETEGVEVDRDVVDLLYNTTLDSATTSVEWLRDTIAQSATLGNIRDAITSISEFFKLHEEDIKKKENAFKYKEQIQVLFNQALAVDFSSDDVSNEGCDFWDCETHKQAKIEKRKTGYKYIDTCLDGGYWDGMLLVFLGAPKVGKSHFLCNACAQSVQNGDNSVYISLEMPEPMIMRRIGSNVFGIEYSKYPEVSDDSAQMRDIIQNYRTSSIVEPGQLVVKYFAPSTMSAEDLEAFILAEERKRSTEDKPFKFKNVFVDYINIMKSSERFEDNLYMKIKSIAEHLKKVGSKNKWAIITATQTNKTQYDQSDIMAKDVSESSGLNATVDAMFGIIKDNVLQVQREYYLKCVYDRVADYQNTRKKFKFDGKFLRLSEDMTTEIEQPTFEANRVITSYGSKKAPVQQAAKGNGAAVPPPATSQPVAPPTVMFATKLMDENSAKGTEINPAINVPKPLVSPTMKPTSGNAGYIIYSPLKETRL